MQVPKVAKTCQDMPRHPGGTSNAGHESPNPGQVKSLFPRLKSSEVSTVRSIHLSRSWISIEFCHGT